MKTLLLLLPTLIISSFLIPRVGATVYNSNGSAADVQLIHNILAVNGDTITLPAGTFTWNTSPSITKGITLQGATTVTGAGGPNPAVNDVTIVKDDVSRNSTILDVSISGNRVFRLTGITFAPGASQVFGSTDGAFHFSSPDSAARVRIDHCHFASLYQAKLIRNSKVYGVADHNAIEVIANSFPFNNEGAIAGTGENGNASWADYPWFGTDKFFFIEDNTLVRHNNTNANSLIDSFYGGRWVARHNYMENMIPSGHGTESGAVRGQRANEFYDNTIKITVDWSGGGQRSGTSLWHDNAFLGHDSDNGNACNLANFRETPARGIQPSGTFTVADGTCPWDQNDTEGNGRYVEGHPPFLFDSGSPSSGTTINGSSGTFTDSTKNWRPNQWAGYSIRDNDPNSASYTLGSYILSNTSNTITYNYYSPNDVNVHLVFNAGGQYQIHRVLVMMDQNGRGRTLDAVYTQVINGRPLPRNPRCGCPLWPRSQLEPCYSWNNVYTPTNHVLGFGGGGEPTTKPGTDYFNLGGGFPADTTPAQVSATYTAAVNGVNYTGTYVYPHPLVAGGSVARAAVADFNGDGRPDFVLQSPNTRQTAIWYLNNNMYVGSAYGPTLAAGWSLRGAADFNRDGYPDYALFNSRTEQTALWYLLGPTLMGGVYGPTIPNGWELVGEADFNGDTKPDYVLYNASTHQTAVWYLNNNVCVGGSYGPTLPIGWTLVGVADFDGDGHPDYLLFYPASGNTAILYLSGTTVVGTAWGPTLPSRSWAVVGAADFNGDGKPDYLLYNESTRHTAIWYLNNNVFVSSAFGPTLPAGWSFAAP